ncbi:DUF2157 domain-containing protein [Corticibacterium sp. UT-5YL-CI-8]|nr:DUF2157 domain-containing protein [Tianweitania sp. UT-5YL-CI-8]
MTSYASRVKKDIMRWVEDGLITSVVAEQLALDVESRDRKALNFGSILAVLAALLFGAAILIFVAANWEGIPRLARVTMLFALILAAYMSGAWFKLRDHAAIGEACWIVGAAAFGGTIALIGQMYHMSGDEASALIVWMAATGLAAAALRSSMLTVFGVGIAIAWLFVGDFDPFGTHSLPHIFLLFLAAFWMLSYWTRSQPARHVILLTLLSYAVVWALDGDVFETAMVVAVVSVVLLALSLLLPEQTDRFVQLGGYLPLHGLIGFMTGIFVIQMYRFEDGGFVLAAIAALTVIAATLVLGGRESKALRWLAYLGFAIELAIVYLVMVGSMAGTAGFFLVAALILALLAFVIIRIEKRMKPSVQGAV